MGLDLRDHGEKRKLKENPERKDVEIEMTALIQPAQYKSGLNRMTQISERNTESYPYKSKQENHQA